MECPKESSIFSNQLSLSNHQLQHCHSNSSPELTIDLADLPYIDIQMITDNIDLLNTSTQSTSCPTASSDYESSVETNAKKYDSIPRVKRTRSSTKASKISNVKRLSTQSNSSSKNSDPEIARFGNKYVIKFTNEYDERRDKNNEAVKKCRQKTLEKHKEREKRLNEMQEENRRLNNIVESLHKELNVLKNIFLQMNSVNKIPNDLDERIKNLEAKIKSNGISS